MVSNFKLIPNLNISQNFVQNVQKQKNTFVLSWDLDLYFDWSLEYYLNDESRLFDHLNKIWMKHMVI